MRTMKRKKYEMFYHEKLENLCDPPPEDILNENHKQMRGGKGNVAHQQPTNFIYIMTRTEIAQRTDRGTFEILRAQYSWFKNIVLQT